MEKRRRFTAEFRREAIGLLKNSGRPVATIARDLGVSGNRLYKWAADAEKAAAKRSVAAAGAQRRGGKAATGGSRSEQVFALPAAQFAAAPLAGSPVLSTVQVSACAAGAIRAKPATGMSPHSAAARTGERGKSLITPVDFRSCSIAGGWYGKPAENGKGITA